MLGNLQRSPQQTNVESSLKGSTRGSWHYDGEKMCGQILKICYTDVKNAERCIKGHKLQGQDKTCLLRLRLRMYIWFQTERWWRFEGSLFRAPTPLCDLTLKWSNFYPIDPISGFEKYVMFQHQVCLYSRKIFDFVCFPRF